MNVINDITMMTTYHAGRRQTSPRSSLVNIFSDSRHSGISTSRLWKRSRVFSWVRRQNDSGSSASWTT